MGGYKHITLPDSWLPREYQEDASNLAVNLMHEQPENWHLFTSPTGTGKSIMLLKLMQELQQRNECPILVTPRIGIIKGMLEKMGHDVETPTLDQLVMLGSSYGMFTPIRLRNQLSKGTLKFNPTHVAIDEAHHDLADSYQDIGMYLNGIPKCGFTATGFRGTPKDTVAFHAQWNNVINEILNLKDAVDQGYCSLPRPSIWPMIDDDIVEVSNGEFKAAAVDSVITDCIAGIVDRIKPMYSKKAGMYDKPTMVALPTTNLINQMYNEMTRAGLPVCKVVQNTPHAERNKAFRDVVDSKKILLQIDVVSEGVDLHIRRLIDARPTMSPVKWLQQIGRIMRPFKEEWEYPEYICCCRNSERHGYLMEGLLPNHYVKEVQEAFGKPSKRAGVRAVGLEGLGRFTSTPVTLLNGLTVFTYSLVAMDEYSRREYFVLVHPNDTQPLYGVKESGRDGEKITWGKWALTESIPDVQGFATAKAYPLTEPQQVKWNQLAEKKGLDPHQKVTNRNIQTLFFLLNTGLKL